MSTHAGYTTLSSSYTEEDMRESLKEDDSKYLIHVGAEKDNSHGSDSSTFADFKDQCRPSRRLEALALSPKHRPLKFVSSRQQSHRSHLPVMSLIRAHFRPSHGSHRKERSQSHDRLLQQMSHSLDGESVDTEMSSGRGETPLAFSSHNNKLADVERAPADTGSSVAVEQTIALLTLLKRRLQQTTITDLLLLNQLLRQDPVERAAVNQQITNQLHQSLPLCTPTSTNSSLLARSICDRLKNCAMKEAQPFHATDTFQSNIDGYIDSKLAGTDTGNGLVRDSDNNVTNESGQLVEILESSHLSAMLRAHDPVSTLKVDSLSLKSSSQSRTGSIDHTQSKSSSTSDMHSNNQSDDSYRLTDVHKVETTLVNGRQRRVITLHKNAEPLGATVRSEGNSIVVARIIEGGMADRTKLLKAGDEILEVNGIDIRGKTVDQMADMMMTLTGDVKIVTQAATSAHIGTSHRHVLRRKITVRAQFDYDVHEDSFIPCVELGLSFQIGDILHIINRDDPHWWQARREDDEPSSLAGLIPSRLFWETREEVRRALLAESDNSIKKKKDKSLCCHSIGRKRNRRKHASKTNNPSTDSDPVLTYEEVGAYGPRPDRRRPIVIVGCEELRLHKLCEKMVALDRDRFSQPIKTSSRPTMFASEPKRAQMQYLPLEKFIEKIKAGEFVEFKVAEEPELHYVGVNKRSVREVIDRGDTCIMHCQPKHINRIRTEEFKPYIIFVAAPPIQRLRTFLRSESLIEPTNDECKHIIDLSRHNESTYSYLYDYVMTVRDTEQACQELLAQITLLEKEEQWVPIGWLPAADGITNSNYHDTNRQSGDSDRISEKIEGCDIRKHSVIADVEPEPRGESPVTSRTGREGQEQVKSSRLSSVGDGPTGDDVQLIPLDSMNAGVLGSDKWVESL